ncbi:MAG TPA: molybdopterin-dependent oxidoreductase [Candidatus Binataceae bacterium]|nr:molybdopterin-dependent oxidoreductase [Candidatus Binataceae bacterium]
MSDAQLRSLPGWRSVSVLDDRGQRTRYEGIPLEEILSRAGTPHGDKLRGRALSLYVVVTAADGYRAVFALAELDPDFTNRLVLLADRRDGHPLSRQEGPFRIVIPEEKRHARWVREVNHLEVRKAQ